MPPMMFTAESAICSAQVRVDGRATTFHLFAGRYDGRECYFFVHYSRIQSLPCTPNILSTLADVIVTCDTHEVKKDRDGCGAAHFIEPFKTVMMVHEVHDL